MTCEHGFKATGWSKKMMEERNNGSLQVYKSLVERMGSVLQITLGQDGKRLNHSRKINLEYYGNFLTM